jgi:tetratricopeptide (TPR) repeat protein
LFSTSFVEALRGLLARRLVEQNTPMEKGAKVTYSLHRSLQMNILHRLDSDLTARQKLFENVLEIIQNTIPDRSKIYLPAPEHWAVWDECLPHVLSLCSIFEGSDPPISGSFKFAALLQGAGQYMWERSMILEGPKLLQAAEKILNHIDFPAGDAFRADLYTPIGLMMHFNGITFRSQGVEYLRKALEVRRQMLPPADNGTTLIDTGTFSQSTRQDRIFIYWIAKMDLGWALLQSERFEEANEIYEQCFQWYKSQEAIEEKLLFQYAKYYHNSSYVLMSRGRRVEAINAAKRALDLCDSSISPTSQHGFMYRFTLGCHYLISGETWEALRIHQDILQDREKILGPTNPETLDSQYIVAITFQKMGEEDLAMYVNSSFFFAASQ